MATERLQAAGVPEPIKPIFIQYRGQPMPLWPKVINGGVFHTTTAEGTQVEKEQFAAMVPPLVKEPTPRTKLSSLVGRLLR